MGCRAAHNLIHDAPHQAVFIGGNDHLFELNEVHHVCTETDDCGALYKGRNPSCRGNVIRFNYWHDIGSPMGHGNAAVYFDDGDGGDLVLGNVFVRCGQLSNGNWQLASGLSWSTDQDPGFVNMDKGDYRLRPGSEAFKKLTGFAPIPFEQVGLQRH